MNSVLLLYIGRQMIARAGILLLAMSALLMLFDLMSQSEDILAFHDDVFQPLWIYATLRFPSVLVMATPIALLLGALSVISRMVQYSEMIAMRAAGFPLYRIAAIFMMIAFVFSVPQFIIANFVVPGDSVTMEKWRSVDYQGKPFKQKNKTAYEPMQSIWFKKGDSLFYVEEASADGEYLRGLKYIKRDKNGAFEHYIQAEDALYANGDWRLINVREPDFGRTGDAAQDDAANIQLADNGEIFDLPLEPSIFAYGSQTQKKDVTQFGVQDLIGKRNYIIAQGKPGYVHTIWLAQKITSPLTNFIMILIAMPMALKLSRRGSLSSFSFILTLSGFLYFISDRMLFTLGESGQLPAIVSVMAMPLIALMIISWLALMQDRR